MDNATFRFAHCEVDGPRRELRVDGKLVPIEPRPFDLLLMLLKHRDRALLTDELLDRLWPGEIVAPASLANAVAKLRRAIDAPGRASAIRTVHRVGYRFAADVIEVVPLGPGTPAMPLAPRTAASVALLPFENLSGDPALDWVELGLMSLVCRSLADNALLEPVPVPMVVAALQRIEAAGDDAARAQALKRLTGAQHVVRTRIDLRVSDYRLEYQLLTANGGSDGGSIVARDPAALGRMLAAELAGRLLAHPAAAAATQASLDPWAQEVLARAMQAVLDKRWDRAVRMLAVVLDIEPDHVTARFEHLNAQAMLHEFHGRFGAALDLWRRLEHEAHVAGQRALAARANCRAALTAALCGLGDEAVRRAEDAIAEAQARGSSELWSRAGLLTTVLWLAGRGPDRLRLLPDGESMPDGLSELAQAGWWSVRGYRLSQRGDRHAASGCLAASARQYRAVRAERRETVALVHWAHEALNAGCSEDAEAAFRRAGELADRQAWLSQALPIVDARLRHAGGDPAGALALLRSVIEGDVFDFVHARACALAAQWSAQGGRREEAIALLARAGPAFARHPMVLAAAAEIARTAGPGDAAVSDSGSTAR